MERKDKKGASSRVRDIHEFVLGLPLPVVEQTGVIGKVFRVRFLRLSNNISTINEKRARMNAP